MEGGGEFATLLMPSWESAPQGCDAVFYGDSITETWRGTDQGKHCPRCKGVPEVFQKSFGADCSSEVLAVGGEVHSLAPQVCRFSLVALCSILLIDKFGSALMTPVSSPCN